MRINEQKELAIKVLLRDRYGIFVFSLNNELGVYSVFYHLPPSEKDFFLTFLCKNFAEELKQKLISTGAVANG